MLVRLIVRALAARRSAQLLAVCADNFGSVAMMAAIVHPGGDAVAHEAGSYTIRYRCRNAHGIVALIVTDDREVAYLFSGGVLQLRCTGLGAATRLAALLRSRAWSPVPSVAPYSFAGLQCLMSARACSADRAAGGTDSLTSPTSARLYGVAPFPDAEMPCSASRYSDGVMTDTGR